MKILHVCLASFYIDNYSYQENLLPKYHKKMGHDVEIVASLFSFDKNGKGYFQKKRKPYINENGILVTRLENKKGSYNKILRRYIGTLEVIQNSKPDIIFIHGCQFLDIKQVKKHAEKNPHVIIYVDNHADFSNSATNWLSKNILHKIVWKRMAKKIEPYTKTFYGVLPARVSFLREMYKIPNEKVRLLPMGADNELVDAANKKSIKKSLRKKYNIKDNDFLVMTGGKIDSAKTQTLLLMKAVKKLDKPNLKLIVFGSVTEELQKEVENLTDSFTVQYIGWINSEESYKYFSMADLVVFPGRHSVFWEQVVGLGLPLVVKHWTGTDHVDLGGNCKFLYDDTAEELEIVLKEIVENPAVYEEMKDNAKSENKNKFLYSSIAKSSIEFSEENP